MKKIILMCICPFALMALPSSMSVEKGQALSSLKNHKLTIENTPGSILHWENFDISKQEIVHFAQASSKSAVLNRVTGNDASQLLGVLSSNGSVFLINPNGIYIGGSAQIQTAGFLASTSDLSNESFAAGDHMLFADPGAGSIVNDGYISCPTGDVFLIAKNVSNHGIISAEHVGLLSAQEVVIRPKGERVLVRLKVENGSIVNTGTIQALTVDLQTTSAYQKAIHHTGKIEACSIKEENGRIFLVAKEGHINVDGQIDAPAGTVHVLAKDIELQDKAKIDVSGSHGGTILVGGDYRGENPDIFNADTLNVADGALIRADGYESHGGKIILWGNERNYCLGSLSAQAFGETGDGGFIEISSPGDWYFKLGRANVLSKNGQIGTKLFDPVNITINAAGPTSPALAAGPTTYTPAVNAVILDSDLSTSLATGNVTLNTSGGAAGVGDVTFSGATVSWSAATTLTVNADRRVQVATTSVVENTGSGSIVFNANTAGTATGDFTGVDIRGRVETVSGDILFTGIGGNSLGSAPYNSGIGVYTATGIVRTESGNITMMGTTSTNTNSGDGVEIGNFDLGSGSIVESTGVGAGLGTITLTGLARTEAIGGSDGVGVYSSSFVRTVDANIIIDGRFDQVTPTGLAQCDGIQMFTGNIISTGEGNISITGTSVTTTGMTFSGGMEIYNNSVISTVNGDITLNGLCEGSGSDGNGIVLIDSSSIQSSGSGNIDITATSTTTTTSMARGLRIDTQSNIMSTGTGTITIAGSGSSDAGSLAEGVLIDGNNCFVSSVDGAVQITGMGGGNGTGTTVQGISVISLANVISTGAATITLDGTGGDGTSGTQGVFVSGSGSAVTSAGGLISLIGVGGSGTSADGVAIVSDAVVSGTGSAGITMDGTASAAGSSNNNGILIDGTATSVNTVSGNISLTGTGDGTGNNAGIQISSAADVTSTSGAITGTGNGGAGGSGGVGINVAGTNTIITAGSGSIDLTGNGFGAGTGNQGILLESNGAVTATGGATIALTGVGSSSGTSSNEGILITDTGTDVTSVSGQITLTGTPGGGTDPGIHITSEGTVVSTTSASIALNTPSGDVLIEELGNVDSQGSGGVTSNIARDLNVSGSALAATPAFINLTNGAANLTVGRDVNVTGGTGIGSEAQIGNHGGLVGSSGASITINASQNVNVTGQNSFGVIGHGDPTTAQTLSGNISVNAAQDIVVTGGGAFVQIGHVNAGGSTLSGDISLNARNDITITGGSVAGAYGRVGLGGQAGATTYNPSTMLLIAGVDISMISNTEQAQIVNNNGALTLVTDDLFPVSPGMGAGGFSINSLISATGELRIYTVTPSQNNINDLLNGAVFVAGPFGVDTAQETWLTYFADGGYGGLPFNIYYKVGILNTMMLPQIVLNVAANLVQLPDLLPILGPSNLGLTIPFNYPAYHFSICQEEKCINKNSEDCNNSKNRKLRTECTPNFAPYGSFIFEDDLHWIGTSW